MTRESIQFIINDWDPAHIIYCDKLGDQGTCNYDEYDPEVDVICRCLARCGGENCSTEKLAEILRVVFTEFFDENSILRSLKRREDGKTFEQVAGEILRDTTAVGTNIAQVELYADDAKNLISEVENRIMLRLFDEKTRTAFARLKILEETYRGRKPALEVWLSLEHAVTIILSAGIKPDPRIPNAAKAVIALADTPEKILQLGQPRIEEIFASCKVPVKRAKWIIDFAQRVQDNYGGEIPRTFGELEKLFKGKSFYSWVRFEILIAVILSAQCTDKRVNEVTKILFPIADTPEKILQLGQARLEKIIRPCGLYKSKATHIIKTSKILQENYGGKVPSDFAELLKLPGVGRKTANVILSVSFGTPALAVDTHVFRLANRLKLAEGKTPLEVELGLQKIIPREKWSDAHHWLIWHGREICKARNPKCSDCPLSKVCPSFKV